jgi:hypothetical protein
MINGYYRANSYMYYSNDLSRAMVFALLALPARNLLEEKDGLAVFLVFMGSLPPRTRRDWRRTRR